jgi:hypothetical protein
MGTGDGTKSKETDMAGPKNPVSIAALAWGKDSVLVYVIDADGTIRTTIHTPTETKGLIWQVIHNGGQLDL